MQRGIFPAVRGLGVYVAAAAVLFVGLLSSQQLRAGDQSRAKELIKNSCASCHRFEGKPDSRFKLRAPDLMWAGSKYQRSWLIGWLTGKEAPLYAKGYRWDLSQEETKHPVVSESDASSLADYFDKHYKDRRVKVGAFDVSKVTAMEVEFGRGAYQAALEHKADRLGPSLGVCLPRSGEVLPVEQTDLFEAYPCFLVQAGIVDGDGDLVRHVLQYSHVLLVKSVGVGGLHVERAKDRLADH